MRAFIYCRVSTKEQGSEDHYSLDAFLANPLGSGQFWKMKAGIKWVIAIKIGQPVGT